MKLPLSFSLNSLFRILLPGFILSLCLLPWTDYVLNCIHYPGVVTYAFYALVIFFGWLLVIADMHIYMIYEGRRYWPKPLWLFFMNKEREVLNTFSEKLERSHDNFLENGNQYDEKIYLEMSVSIRQFPIDEETGERISRAPTRLGNILNMYETYSEVMYGLDGVFYWHRLWILLEKDVREDFEAQQAYVDSAIYTSAAFFISGFVILSYPFCGFFDIISLSNSDNYILLFISAFCFIFGYFIYRISLHLHMQFGETWKSLFDLYRSKLSVIDVEEEVVAWTSDPSIMARHTSREKRKIIWSYLQYYRIWCEKKGQSFAAPKYSRECNRLENDNDQT